MSLHSKENRSSEENVENNAKLESTPTSALSTEKAPDALAPAVPEEVTGVKLWIIMIAISLACFLMLLDVSILVTAVPHITSEFQSLSNVGWYGAAYQLASAALQPLSGKFYANFSTKWTFLTFFAIFELGSLLCGVAVSSNMLIIGRAVAGLGSSGIQNGTFTIIAGMVPMPKRPMLTGIAFGIAQFGTVIGPLIGGALTQYTSWRWCFYINLPCGAVLAALLGIVHIPEVMAKPKPSAVLRDLHRKVDIIGFLLFAPAIVMLLLAVQWGGNEYKWDSSVVIGLFVGSGANALVWLAWDWRQKDAAMIPLPMLKKTNVWSGCLTAGFLMSSVFCTSYYLPIYFQGVKGASPVQSGVYMLPSVISQLVSGLICGKLLERLGYYLPFSVISGVLTAIGYGLSSSFTPNTSTGKWIGYQILFGIGRGCGMQMPLIAVQNTLPPPQIPTAMALVIFSTTFLGSLFLSFSDTIFTNSLSTLIPKYAPGVDATTLISAGATEFRKQLSGAQLQGALVAYSKSIDRVFYMITALAACCAFTALGLGWKDIRRKDAPPASKA